MVHRGKILLRDDSAMNLSCAMYDEFIKPYDQRLLDELGGGGIHFCGKGDHFIESASSMRGLTCVDMSQPEYNDLEAILRNTVDKGINLLQLQPWAVESAVASGRELRGRVHCWQWPWRS
jgi:uroporphyrinogen-III decarboxylase